jgi:uncharacterized protein (TIGR02145 family)
MELRILFFASAIFLFYNSYSQEMIDIDGNIYKSAKIGVQNIRYGYIKDNLGNIEVYSDSFLIWTTSNLNVSKFRDGTPILEAKTSEQWNYAIQKGIPAYCNIDNDSSYGKTYGKLYNYYAVSSLKDLAPQGWHIASDFEWGQMFKYYKIKITEADLYEGVKVLMSTKWKSGYKWGYGNNKTGFNALQSGYRSTGGFTKNGAYYWSDIPIVRKNRVAFHSILGDNYICDFGCDITYHYGFSVRCIKDW